MPGNAYHTSQGGLTVGELEWPFTLHFVCATSLETLSKSIINILLLLVRLFWHWHLNS